MIQISGWNSLQKSDPSFDYSCLSTSPFYKIDELCVICRTECIDSLTQFSHFRSSVSPIFAYQIHLNFLNFCNYFLCFFANLKHFLRPMASWSAIFCSPVPTTNTDKFHNLYRIWQWKLSILDKVIFNAFIPVDASINYGKCLYTFQCQESVFLSEFKYISNLILLSRVSMIELFVRYSLV